MRMKGWTNITTGEVKGEKADNMLAFAGIHVVSQNISQSLHAMGKEVFPVMDFYLTNCRDMQFSGYRLPSDTLWVDCGKPESLTKAAEILKEIC